MIVCLMAMKNLIVFFTLFGFVCAQIKTAEVIKTLWKLVISQIQNVLVCVAKALTTVLISVCHSD